MKNFVVSAALILGLLAGLALACGRYGPPERVERRADPAPSVPLTDPGVSR